MRNNTAIRFLFDQLTNGQLQWSDVADDYDTVVLVDDENQDAASLKTIEQHVKNGTTLPSFQCSMLSGRERTIVEVRECVLSIYHRYIILTRRSSSRSFPLRRRPFASTTTS